MKPYIVLALILAICLSLLACGADPVENESLQALATLPRGTAPKLDTPLPSDAPADAPTQVPTEEPTAVPTEDPTQAPTEAPTETPTEAPTETPTEAPTEASTEAPTEAPTEPPSDDPTDPTEGAARDYVLNTNSRKFHYPTCGSVSKIKDKNRRDFHGTREEVIRMGYEPCKNCNP